MTHCVTLICMGAACIDMENVVFICVFFTKLILDDPMIILAMVTCHDDTSF